MSLLGLTTLERRRVRVRDLIETFKILTGREKINKEDFFQLADQTDQTLFEEPYVEAVLAEICRTTIRANSFSMRVVDEWNALPQEFCTQPVSTVSIRTGGGSFLESGYEIIEPLGFFTHQPQVQVQVRPRGLSFPRSVTVRIKPTPSSSVRRSI